MSEKLKELLASLQYYTGGAYYPDHRNQQLVAVAKKLEEENISADWFCYFICTHYFAGDSLALVPFRPDLLQQPSRLASEAVWDKFKEYLKTRAKDIKTLVRIQQESLRTFLKVYGNPLGILKDNLVPLNVLVKLDFALQQHYTEGVDVSDILQKYEPQAELVWKGCPEYLEYCLHLRAYLKERGYRHGWLSEHQRSPGVRAGDHLPAH